MGGPKAIGAGEGPKGVGSTHPRVSQPRHASVSGPLGKVPRAPLDLGLTELSTQDFQFHTPQGLEGLNHRLLKLFKAPVVPPGHQKPSPAARYSEHSLTADPPGSNGGCSGAGRPLQASEPATSRPGPSRPARATLEEPEGMAKGVRLGGPRGVAWAAGWSGGRASYPCSRKRGGETGVRRAGAGLLGKATGEVTRGGGGGKRGSGGLGGGALLASSFP
jgi:hypothetical protein